MTSGAMMPVDCAIVLSTPVKLSKIPSKIAKFHLQIVKTSSRISVKNLTWPPTPGRCQARCSSCQPRWRLPTAVTSLALGRMQPRCRLCVGDSPAVKCVSRISPSTRLALGWGRYTMASRQPIGPRKEMPCQQRWHLEKDATQMAAISWRLTTQTCRTSSRRPWVRRIAQSPHTPARLLATLFAATVDSQTAAW